MNTNPFTTRSQPACSDSSEAPVIQRSKAIADNSLSLDELLSRNPAIWRGCNISGQGDYGLTTGYPELDNILPGRGWPRNGTTEIITPCWGLGELQLLLPLMVAAARDGKWMMWVSPPYSLYGPALAQAGIALEQVLIIDLESSCRDALWATEQALQAPGCGLVLAWQKSLPHKTVRRLQLAAQAGNTPGVLLQHKESKHSQPCLRLKIENTGAHSMPSVASHSHHSNIRVTVTRARGNFRPLSVCLDLYQTSLPGTGNSR